MFIIYQFTCTNVCVAIFVCAAAHTKLILDVKQGRAPANPLHTHEELLNAFDTYTDTPEMEKHRPAFSEMAWHPKFLARDRKTQRKKPQRRNLAAAGLVGCTLPPGAQPDEGEYYDDVYEPEEEGDAADEGGQRAK
jgi:hypothetical protein